MANVDTPYGDRVTDSLVGRAPFSPPPPSFFGGFGDAAQGEDAITAAVHQQVLTGAAAALHQFTAGYAGQAEMLMMGEESYESAPDSEYELRLRHNAERLTPKPGTVGIGTQAVMGLAGFATKIAEGAIGGPVGSAITVGGTSAYESYYRARDAGVDDATATKLAATEGLANGAFAMIPLGQMARDGALALRTLKAAGSGIAANVGLGAASRYANKEILEAGGYPDIAAQYDPLDSLSLLTDATLGALPAALHGTVEASLLRAAAHAGRNDGHLEDAARALADARAQRERAPGIPIDPASASAHAEAESISMSQLLRGDAIDLSNAKIAEGASFLETPEDRAAIAQARDVFQGELLEQLKEAGLDHTEPEVQRVAQALGLEVPRVEVSPREREQSVFTNGHVAPIEEVRAEEAAHGVEPGAKEPEPVVKEPTVASFMPPGGQLVAMDENRAIVRLPDGTERSIAIPPEFKQQPLPPEQMIGGAEALRELQAKEGQAAEEPVKAKKLSPMEQRDARLAADYEEKLAQGYVFFSYGKGDFRTSPDGKTIEVLGKGHKWQPSHSAAVRNAAFKAMRADRAKKETARVKAEELPQLSAAEQAELRRMADRAGWAEVGGKGVTRLGEGEHEGGLPVTTGETSQWIPFETWFQEQMTSKERLPGNADYREVIERGLAGGKLSVPEKRTYLRMAEIAKERAAELEHQVAALELQTPESSPGADESTKRILALHEHAAKIDNDRAQAVFETWEKDDPETHARLEREFQEIIDEPREPPPAKAEVSGNAEGAPGERGLTLTASPGEDELRAQRAAEQQSLRTAAERRWADEDRERHPFTLTGSDRVADLNPRQSDLMDAVAREKPDATVIDQTGKAVPAEEAIERIDQLEQQAKLEAVKAFDAAADCAARQA